MIRRWPVIRSVRSMVPVAASLLVAAMLVSAQPAVPAGAAGPDLSAIHVKLVAVRRSLVRPVALAWRKNDSRIYVAQQGGTVLVLPASSTAAPTTVLTLSVSTGGEQGLLGITFSPDGTKLYADYTDPAGNTQVDEFPMKGDIADVAHKRHILTQVQPYANHNGGNILFGPDGMLYIGFGDGGSLGDPQLNGQKMTTFLGKILRIDPHQNGFYPYKIPATNPFATSFVAKREIWMSGLRNPWRYSFDKATGDMWIGDVGQSKYEEVDYAAAGTGGGYNWGWSQYEGFHTYKGPFTAHNARNPLLEHPHTDGDCAVIGGYVYRGTTIPSLQGIYVYSDSCTGKLYAATQSGGVLGANGFLTTSATVTPLLVHPTTFGQNSLGELYIATVNGAIFRLSPA